MCDSDLNASNDIAEMKRKNVVVVDFKSISQKESEKTEKGEIEEKMKNIRKRKDGRWEGRKQLNGKIIYVYGKTQKECNKELQKTIKLLTTPFTTPTKFYEFSLYWFENYKKGNIGKDSESNYINYIKHDFKSLNYNLNELNVDILQRFINSFPPTRKREYCLMILKQVIKKAYELDLIEKDYGQFLTKGKIQRQKVSWFNIEEQAKILQNLTDDKFSLTIYTFLLTGCRPNEIKTIKKDNIKNNLLLIDGTKTKNAKRWIKISDWLQSKLINQEKEIIFENFNNDLFARKFRKFLEKINLKGTIYMLRHTFATNLFYLGLSDKERQSYMGHSSSVLTNDVYTEFNPNITKNDILNLYINLYPKF